MPGERKSVEPIAAIVVSGARCSGASVAVALRRAVGVVGRGDTGQYPRARDAGVGGAGRHRGLDRRRHRVSEEGLAFGGGSAPVLWAVGKTDNCQIAVTLSVANHQTSLPIAYRLYLPETWANDAERREKAHVPEDVEFQTKPQIALSQIKAAMKAGVTRGVVLADAGYGCDGAFRAGVTALGLSYAMGAPSTLSVWPPGQVPPPAKPWSGRGRPPSRVWRDGDHQPLSAKEFAKQLPAEAWKEVEWREGSNQTLSSRFTAVRIRPASRDHKLAQPHPSRMVARMA